MALDGGSIEIRYGLKADRSFKDFEKALGKAVRDAEAAGRKIEGAGDKVSWDRPRDAMGRFTRETQQAGRASQITAGQIARSLRGVEGAANRLNRGVNRAFRASAYGITGLATAAAGAAAKMVMLASDAQETGSKFDIVFKEQAGAAIRQLDAFSKATGASRYVLRQQAADLQALIRPMGMSTKAAADMSVGMTKLATDLSSFNNVPVEDALLAIRAGLVGEAEPLRRFGVQLSAARIEAHAMSKGMKTAYKDMDAATKATLAYELILKDTTLAQNDATRTSGSFANQLRAFQNQVKDTATDVGVNLLPTATKILNSLNDTLKRYTPQIKKFGQRVGEILQGPGGLQFKAEAIWDELVKTGLPAKVKEWIVQGFSALAEGAIKGIVNIFNSSNIWGKLAIVTILGARLAPLLGIIAKLVSGGFARGAAMGAPALAQGASRGLGMGGKLMRGAGYAGLAMAGGELVKSATGNDLLGGVLGGAGMGASIGSVFGPQGMIAGALLGGLTSAFIEFGKSPTVDEVADEWSKSLTKGMEAGATDALRSATKKVEEERRKAANGKLPFQQAPTQGLKDAEAELGVTASAALAEKIKGGPQFTTVGRFMSQVTEQFKNLPARARQAGTTTVLELARAMEKDGRLPVGATKQITDRMKGNWADTREYIVQKGLDTARGLERSIRAAKVAEASQGVVNQIKQKWADAPRFAKLTGDNVAGNLQRAMAFLSQKVATSTGDARRIAQQQLNQVKAQYNSLPATAKAAAQRNKTEMDKVPTAARDAANKTKGHMQAMTKSIKDQQTPIGNALRSIGGFFSSAAGKVKDFVGSLAGKAKDGVVAGFKFLVPGLSTGGFIDGPRGRGVPVVVHGQERILNADQFSSLSPFAQTEVERALEGAPTLRAGGEYAKGAKGKKKPAKKAKAPTKKKTAPKKSAKSPTKKPTKKTPAKKKETDWDRVLGTTAFEDGLFALERRRMDAARTPDTGDDSDAITRLIDYYRLRQKRIGSLLKKYSRAKFPEAWRSLNTQFNNNESTLSQYVDDLRGLNGGATDPADAEITTQFDQQMDDLRTMIALEDDGTRKKSLMGQLAGIIGQAIAGLRERWNGAVGPLRTKLGQAMVALDSERDGLVGSSDSMSVVNPAQAFVQARESLWASFGSNARAAATGQSVAGARYDQARATGGAQVQQVINISQPPTDPFSFSRQLAYELKGAL